MAQQPRTIRYDGATPAAIIDVFEADALGAEEHDWYATSQSWADDALFVVYEHDPDRRLRAAARQATRSGPRRQIRLRPPPGPPGGESRILTLVLIGLIVAAVIGVTMIATNPPGPPIETPGPTSSLTLPGPESPAPRTVAPSSSPAASLRPERTAPPEMPQTFRDGVWEVGEDIKPGTYRTLGADGCYWSRLRRLTNRDRDVIVQESSDGPAIVTVKRSDVGFESGRCRSWTADLGRITDSRTEFGAGTYLVGEDIAPGTYRSRGKAGCSWERLRGFTGDQSDILAKGTGGGRRTVTVRGTDTGFSSVGCGTWTRASR